MLAKFLISNSQSPLAKSIYQTLAFFDAQDLPLTLLEIMEYLVAHNSSLPPLTLRGGAYSVPPLKVRGEKGELLLSEIEKTIKAELNDLMSYRTGFYFLSGREALVKSRIGRYRTSLLRFRKCRKFLSPLRFFPYVRAVAISGSQALLNAQESSDIDLFIITKKNRIWLTRLLVSLYFQILGQRRHGDKVAGRFCLNHYLCEGQTITEDRNLYTAVEYASLIPVVGGEIINKFWQQNRWIKNYLVSSAVIATSPFFPLRDRGGGRDEIQRIAEILFEITLVAPPLNYLSGLYQKRRIRRQEHILISDSELSFHPGSRGQKVLARFAQSLDSSEQADYA